MKVTSIRKEELLSFLGEDFEKEPRPVDRVRNEFGEVMSIMGYEESDSSSGTVSYSYTCKRTLSQYLFNVEYVMGSYKIKSFVASNGKIESSVFKVKSAANFMSK